MISFLLCELSSTPPWKGTKPIVLENDVTKVFIIKSFVEDLNKDKKTSDSAILNQKTELICVLKPNPNVLTD